MRRLLFLLPIGVFVTLAIWMAVPLIRGDDPSQLPSVLIGRPAPATELPPLPGYEDGLSSADLAEGPMLVNVFASWCVPCVAEHPTLSALAESGVTINAINYRDAPEDAARWLERHGDPYARIGSDAQGRAGLDWGVTGVPETFLIDAQGVVRHRFVGPIMDAEDALRRLAELGA